MSSDSILKRIVNLRDSKDWSQAELGRRIGLDKSTMNKIENGTRKIQTDELIAISKLFEVSVDYLLNGNDGYKKQWDDSFETADKQKEKIETIAAHIDDDVTDEQMEDIVNYIEFIKQKHSKKD